jgi:hypothetical protein
MPGAPKPHPTPGPELMSSSPYDEALASICAALTEAERDSLTRRFSAVNLRYRGAEPADILDALWEHDACLDIRAEFFDANPDLGDPAATLALLAVVTLGDRAPARDKVVSLMHRAGLARLGPADVFHLASEVAGLSVRTVGMAADAADLGSAELTDALGHLGERLASHAQVLTRLAGTTMAAHKVFPLDAHEDTWRCSCGTVFASPAGPAICPGQEGG